MGSLDKVQYAHYPPVKITGGSGITVDQTNLVNPLVSFTGGISDVSGLSAALSAIGLDITSLDGRLDVAEGLLTSQGSRITTLENDHTNLLRKDQDQTTSYWIQQNIPYFSGYFSGYTNANFSTTPNLVPTLNQSIIGGGMSSTSATSRITVGATGLYFFLARSLAIFQTTVSGVQYLQIKSSGGSIIGQAYTSNPSASLGVADLIATALIALSANDYVSFNLFGNHPNVTLYTFPQSMVAAWRVK